MNFSDFPNRIQIASFYILLTPKFLLTTIHLDTNCRKNCFILVGQRTFQKKTFNGATDGLNYDKFLSLSGHTRST